MDMQIGIFCGIFSIIASVVVYAILSFYSIKEDSFDEAKANRRKLFKEYLDQRTNAEKTKQKKPKKVVKKVKDKRAELPFDKANDKKETSAPEIPKEALQSEVAKKSEAPVKSNTKTKSQPSEKVDNAVPAFSISSNAPVNESLTKKASEKKSKAKIQEKKSEQETNQNNGGAIPKESEKKVKQEAKPEKKKSENGSSAAVLRKQSSGADKQIINVNSIITLIQKAELSRSEVQLLIDTLLNSEDETSEWLKVKKLDSGKQENCVKLRKQLSEFEQSLKNEKQITLSLQGKLKELRTEMASDKTNVSVLKEALNKIQQEKDDLLYEKSDLSFKMKAIIDEKNELQDLLNKELAKAQHQQQLEDERNNEASNAQKEEIDQYDDQIRLFEDLNAALKSTVSSLEEELSLHKNCHEKATGLEKAIDTLSEKLNEKEMEISSSRKQLDTLSSTLNKFKKECNDLKTKNEQLAEKLSTSNKEIERMKEEIDELVEKQYHATENGDDADDSDIENYQQIIEEKEIDLQQLTQQINSNVKDINELKQLLVIANEENEKLKSSLDRVNSELFGLKENNATLKANELENEHLVENLRNNINKSNNEITFLKEEIEKYKQQVNEENNTNGMAPESLKSLMLQLEEKDKCIEKMTKEIDITAKLTNDLKQTLNNSNKENSSLKVLLDQSNTELTDLREKIVLIKARNAEAEETIANLKSDITICNQEIKSLKERNNELRNKNWKVVQALTDAEKALQIKLRSQDHENGNNHKCIEELKSNVNIFVRRLFPDIDIQEYQGHFNDWLRSVEDTVSSTKSQNNSQDLQKQNTHLQSLVVNYKKIISDTEHMLNELQKHVEVEESKWKEQCTSYEKEIECLRALQRTS